MREMRCSDAFPPAEVAQRVQDVAAQKTRQSLLQLLLLGVLAGFFIGLGAMFFTLVKSDATLGYAASQVLGGAVFSLGLLLVVVAGAELFTGNNLMIMGWVDNTISSRELLRHWIWACLANFVGAAGLALLVYASGHAELNSGAIGRKAIAIAQAKQELSTSQAFFRALLCNMLVCLAVWMTLAGRSVVDKAVAIVFPISAFVAAGFEHSIANMYFFPLALLVQEGGHLAGATGGVTVMGMLCNLGTVIAGNVCGGLLVALGYYTVYRYQQPKGNRTDWSNS